AYPTLLADGEAALELIYGEFLVREELGERPSPEEYGHRFPPFAARLQQQIQLHRVFDAGAGGSGSTMLPAGGSTLFPVGKATTAPAGAAPPPASAGAARPAGARYEILGWLGRGGMGVVYQAGHLGLDRLVALKMIVSGAHASTEEADRFRNEAQAAARLQHPNIVQIFEVGEQDGCPF